ncbi:MAG: aromatic amino acid lyase [Ignavibacteriaceae bacterium]|nr:aromatic amino acid lyase [Ignavibacteriaceae bacterium]
MDSIVILDGRSLSVQDILTVSKGKAKVDLSAEAKSKIASLREELEKMISDDPGLRIYGINVGAGNLKDTPISVKEAEKYQIKYLLSHNCGTGKEVPLGIVRAMMVIRLNSFAAGKSGIKPDTCELMTDMLNHGVTPVVREEGSVGASGDLVPLSMIAAVLAGLDEAEAYYGGVKYDAKTALKKAGLRPVALGFKEAMGLTNGTNLMSGYMCSAAVDSEKIYILSNIAAALSLEAIRGEKDAFSKELCSMRPHEGIIKTAEMMRKLIKGSQRMSREAQQIAFKGQTPDTVQTRVQDRYSFRAVPPVHGSLYEAVQEFNRVLSVEVNSVTDNPLFLHDDETGELRAFSGSNFHGQPLASVIDHLKSNLTAAGLISDKRSFSMLNKYLSFGLPSSLAYDPSKGDTGLMIAQYAGAARAADCRVLSTPASVTSITTSAGQEDFVSMGSIGVLHLRKITENLKTIIAIEVLCAYRALEMTNNNEYLPENLTELGKGTGKIFSYLAGKLHQYKGDYYVASDIEHLTELLFSDEFFRFLSDELNIGLTVNKNVVENYL